MKYKIISFGRVYELKSLSALINNDITEAAQCLSRLCEKLAEKGILDASDISDVFLNNSLERIEIIKDEEVAE